MDGPWTVGVHGNMLVARRHKIGEERQHRNDSAADNTSRDINTVDAVAEKGSILAIVRVSLKGFGRVDSTSPLELGW